MPAGRPLKLDETKQAQVAALVAAGLTVRDAARLVGCNRSTVCNAARRDRQFGQTLARAKSQARIHPLRTMQQAAANNWRAAAWWLERLAPDTFAQPVTALLGRREANRFVADLIAIVDQAVSDPAERERLTELLSAAMPRAMRRAWNYRQSQRKLGQAMEYFDQLDRDGRGDKHSQSSRPMSAHTSDTEGELGRLVIDDPQTERNLAQLFASIEASDPSQAAASNSGGRTSDEKFCTPTNYSSPRVTNSADGRGADEPRSLAGQELRAASGKPPGELFSAENEAKN